MSKFAFRFWQLSLAILLVIGFTSGLALGETFEVKFVVADSDGNPVVKAELSTRWILGDGKFEAVFDSTAKTDQDGKATIEFEDYGYPTILLGYSEDRQQGGFVVVERQDENSVVEVKFQPTIEVTANYVCTETDSVPMWTNTIISVEDVRGYFFEFRATDGTVKFPLPPGKWKLRAYGAGIVDKRKEFKTEAGESELKLGEIDFEAEAIAKLKGKAAPKIEIADARGLPKDFQLADLKGKWVLIEFWGYW